MNKKPRFLVYLILLLALAAAVYLAGKSQETRKSAYFAGASVSILPEAITGTVGTYVPVQVWVTTNAIAGSTEPAKVSSLDTTICYGDGLSLNAETLDTDIQLNTLAFNTFAIKRIEELATPIDGTKKCLKMTLVASGMITSDKLQSGTFRAATIRFWGTAVGSGKVIINTVALAGHNPVPNATDMSLEVGQKTGANYTIGGGVVPTETQCQIPSIVLTQEGMVIRYQVSATNCPTWMLASETGGAERIAWGWSLGGASSGTAGPLFSIDPTDKRVVPITVGKEYCFEIFEGSRDSGPNFDHFLNSSCIKIVSPTPTVTPPIPTSTPPVTGNWPILNYSLAFRNVVPGNMCATGWPVTITAMAANGTTKIYTNQMPVRDTTITDRVVYKGQLTLTDFAYTDKLAIFIKGPKHLQTKYGVNNQEDYYNQPGGTITLTNDPNTTPTYDFSKYPLMPGDVTGPTSGVQDGTVDGRDYAFIKAAATDRTKVADGQFLMPDLDGNCQVDGMDTAYFKLTLKDKLEQIY